MSADTIIQIVSGFAPDVDGMGDYSRRLAIELWRQRQIRSHIVVYRRPVSSGTTPLEDSYSISYPKSATAEGCLQHVFELIASGNPPPVLLHWGPYAYTSNGLPLPFTSMVEQLSEKVRLHTLFHETWAHGWPWRRAFWTRRNQREAACRILSCSNASFTSSDFYHRRLDRLQAGNAPITTVRIFSNIGEIRDPKPLRERARRLVVFGQKTTREGLYRNHAEKIQAVVRNLRLESIVDVGSGESKLIPSLVGTIPVERVGYLSESSLSALLADSVAGVLQYGAEVWEKSGVLAAYQAHGVVPILAPRVRDSFRPFPDMPFVLIEDVSRPRHSLDETTLQAIADRIHAYYRSQVSVDRAISLISRNM